MTLAIDKIDECGHINTTCREHLPKKTKAMLATEGLPERQSASFIKVSDAFKRRLVTVISRLYLLCESSYRHWNF